MSGAIGIGLLLAGCATAPPAPVPVVKVVRMLSITGEAKYRSQRHLPEQARLRVRLVEHTAQGDRTLAESSAIPVKGKVIPFEIKILESALPTGHSYALKGQIEGKHGRLLFEQPAPAPVTAAVAQQPVTLWLVPDAFFTHRKGPVPSSKAPLHTGRGPANLTASGRNPYWIAKTYGVGKFRQISIQLGHQGLVREDFDDVRRQRLRSGIVVYSSRDGWVRLTIRAGKCRLAKGKKSLWRAWLETSAATYRGCAVGTP